MSSTDRGNTMPWQKRPQSRGAARPLSMMATQNASQRFSAKTQDDETAAPEQTLSREDIAKTLGLKDPSWFRQTADRGQGSAALRKNQVEDNDRLDLSSLKSELPGMSTKPSGERSTSRSDFMSPTQAKLASPFPLSGMPSDEASEAQEHPSDLPSGRTSPVRAASPTKGMGGFVQSAMLKRSDSIKRWSVASPPALSRADSVTAGPGGRSSPMPRQHTGSHDTLPGAEAEVTPEATPLASEVPPRAPATPTPSLPSSPSKPLDARRWSPSKSSWLDSALNRPESPKPGHRPAASQPDWMADLNKMKQNASKESGSRPSSPHKHQVSIGGLMRSTPFEGRGKTNTTGLGGIYSPPPGGNRPAFGHGSKPSFSLASGQNESAPPSPTKDITHLEQEPQDLSEVKAAQVEPPMEAPVESPPIATEDKSAVPPVKAKPAPPPKTDFRSNLKQRSIDAGSKKTEEPEFKNVFGNLRRTKTQNYVAPDELKANIMKGKSALNTTGGPQKTERKDEFKDAILKKKEDFKTAQSQGRGITRVATGTTKAPLPEGLARRAELSRPTVASASKDAAIATSTKSSSPASKITPKRVPSITTPSAKTTASRSSPADSKTHRVSGNLGTNPPASPAASSSPSGLRKTSSPLSKPQEAKAPAGKLAARFNPALAGMLARGPPPMVGGAGKSSDGGRSGPSAESSTTEPTAPGPQLTHMTKNRARGPKRKAPNSASATKTVKTEPRPIVSEPEAKPEAKSEAILEAKPEPVSQPSNDDTQTQTAPQSEPEETVLPSVEEVAPVLPSKSSARAAAREKPTITPSPLPEKVITKAVSTPRSPVSAQVAKANTPTPVKVRTPSSSHSKPLAVDTKRATASPNVKQTPVKTPSKSPAATNVITPTHLHGQGYMVRTPTTTDSPTRERRETTPSMATPSRRFPPTSSPERRPTLHGPRKMDVSRPKSRGGPRPLSVASESIPIPSAVSSPNRSPIKQANEITSLFNDFFGPPRPRQQYMVDTGAILTHHKEIGAKVTTLDAKMIRISGDGKKTPISTDLERVLFEEEMYICAHRFASPAGKQDFEVYFWVGDEVSEAAVQDAQLFANREAKDAGGRLVKIYQGKETTEFLQALGGVMITRRGSSDRFDSLAPHLLCGRQFLGQVVFDEMDMKASSLCSGFPYIISDESKCYLWKGKGAGVDELSATKLVAMELAVTGELIEYDDGQEPTSFWELFGDDSKAHSADHWRLKPTYSKYCSRLFCSDADSRQQVSSSTKPLGIPQTQLTSNQITELGIFSQNDLSPLKIYVLDAFFEMYIIVGSGAQSQYSSFRNALDFAQEYAILSASVEDRPFVPVSTIVLEGIPRDMKRVFRKWSETRSPTVTNTYAGLQRGKSLRIVSLTQALQALRE